MLTDKNKALKTMGRGMMKVANQKSGSTPPFNPNFGDSDGGVGSTGRNGRGYVKHKSIKGGK